MRGAVCSNTENNLLINKYGTKCIYICQIKYDAKFVSDA